MVNKKYNLTNLITKIVKKFGVSPSIACTWAIMGPLVFVGCKGAAGDGSRVKGLNDGGCYEYIRRLNNLMSERAKLSSKPAGSASTGAFLYAPSADEPLRKNEDTVRDSGRTSNTISTGSISTGSISTGSISTGSISASTSAALKDLDRQIEQARLDLSICKKNKAGEIDTVKIQGAGDAGHCDFNGQPYDILNYNCHSAANQSVSDSPFNTGIVSCRGLGPMGGDPSGHTFNYRVEGNLIVYYNWGQTCKAPKKTLPPDISDPDHQACARAFCGKQFSKQDSLALPVGQSVEQPGPLYCASNSSSKSTCDSCCQYRGKYWDLSPSSYRPNDSTFREFMSQCYNACSRQFAH